MEYTVENICGFLIRSKLLVPEDVKAMHQRWLDEARDAAGNLNQFSRWLVANKYVTEYQAALLLKGQADDFFLNQYQILDRLGRGRMAGVYKAVHQLGQVVAIKVLPPSKAKNPQLLGRFQREANLAMRMKHPNVVRTFQVGESRGLQYLVMEYLEGETLDEVLQRRRRLPANEAVRLIYQALLGLQHIHEQGVIHRDLKPANLMLVPAPGRGEADTTLKANVKILDIGLARAMFEEAEAPSTPANPELTGEGVLLGTPDYLSPEQARDPRAIDIRADIYSLGCVLYHALTGQPPFPDKNLLSQMVRHASEPARPLKEFNPAIPDGLQQIINWMMAKKPEERYPTPERAAQALQVFLVAESLPERPAEEPKMRQFLTWLETSEESPQDETRTGPNPAAMAMPTTSFVPPSPVVSQVKMKSSTSAGVKANPLAGPARHERSHKKPRPKGALADTAAKSLKPLRESPQPAPTPADATMNVDVELVPLETVPAVAGKRSLLFALSRRDWIMLGIGAGSVILAGLVGMLLALVFQN